MSWDDWASGVLDRLGAPVDSANVDTLWAWSGAESGTDRMRWNNPLNTTWKIPGSISENSVGVQGYPTITDGVMATVDTLLQQGYYPTIVSHLRNSVPRRQWSDCCGQLGLWGTGCGWINLDYGAYSGSLTGGIDLTSDEHNMLQLIYDSVTGGFITDASGNDIPAPIWKVIGQDLDAIKAQIAAIAPGGGLSATDEQTLNNIAAILGRIEAALKAA